MADRPPRLWPDQVQVQKGKIIGWVKKTDATTKKQVIKQIMEEQPKQEYALYMVERNSSCYIRSDLDLTGKTGTYKEGGIIAVTDYDETQGSYYTCSPNTDGSNLAGWIPKASKKGEKLKLISMNSIEDILGENTKGKRIYRLLEDTDTCYVNGNPIKNGRGEKLTLKKNTPIQVTAEVLPPKMNYHPAGVPMIVPLFKVSETDTFISNPSFRGIRKGKELGYIHPVHKKRNGTYKSILELT